MPSPLRDFYEDHDGCHCFHLRMTWEHTGMRNNNFLVANLAKELIIVVIVSATLVYSKTVGMLKQEYRFILMIFKTYFLEVDCFYSDT